VQETVFPIAEKTELILHAHSLPQRRKPGCEYMIVLGMGINATRLDSEARTSYLLQNVVSLRLSASHEMRRGHADGMQNGGEGVRSLGELGEAVVYKAIPNNNQTQRNGGPVGYRSSIQKHKTIAPSLFQWFANVIHVKSLPSLARLLF
jgi:hypothetical protein